jgi:hypothetical protein
MDCGRSASILFHEFSPEGGRQFFEGRGIVVFAYNSKHDNKPMAVIMIGLSDFERSGITTRQGNRGQTDIESI